MSVLARGIAGCALAAGIGLFSAASSIASPMNYSATVVTDIKVGKNLYQQATVTLTFSGDTNDIQPVVDGHGNQVTSAFCSGTVFYWLYNGTAALSVQAHGHTLKTHFLPNQIFVALDTCNGGIGFGSFTGPNGVEPVYPLAFTLGTAMTVAVEGGLWIPADMSGNAWSCVGYPPGAIGNLPGTPDQACIPPDGYPLKTYDGDVVVYMPYTVYPLGGDNHVGSLNRGTFSITAGASE
jgi:hypothetical protein